MIKFVPLAVLAAVVFFLGWYAPVGRAGSFALLGLSFFLILVAAAIRVNIVRYRAERRGEKI